MQSIGVAVTRANIELTIRRGVLSAWLPASDDSLRI
jgi:hypothetical protein